MGYREECEKLYIENKEMKKMMNEKSGIGVFLENIYNLQSENKKMKVLINWLWENEPEKTEMLDKIQEYLKINNEN